MVSAKYKPHATRANYEVIRHDREDGYGGVLLAIRKDYIFEKLDIDVDIDV